MADRPAAGDVICGGAEHALTIDGLDVGPHGFPFDDGGPHCTEAWTLGDADRIGLCACTDTAYMPLSRGMYERWCVRPCRRGLAICHEHDDCRRSLAIALACAEGRS